MTRVDVQSLLVFLNSIYETEVTSQRIDDWHVILADADADAITAAAKRHAEQSEFPPKPATLRAGAKVNGLNTRAYRRWGELREKFQQTGELSPEENAEWDQLEIEIGMPPSARRRQVARA